MKHLSKLLIVPLCLCALLAFAACSSGQSSASQSASSSGMVSMNTNESTMSSEPAPEPFYVLVIGNDTRIGTVEINEEDYADGLGRSDTVMLVRVDPANYKVTIVSIPRDTAIDLDGNTVKFNTAYRDYGIEGAIEQVKELTGVTPKYYLDMSFVQFEDFIDALGGVEVDVPVAMDLQDIVSGDHVYLDAGEQRLDGAEALVLARVRKIYSANLDAVRQGNDRAIVIAGITAVANNPDFAKDACKILVENCDTNWDVDDMTALVEDFAAHSDQLEILAGTGPYEGDSSSGVWLAYRDEDTWRELMDHVNEGGDPTDIVSLPELSVG